MAHIGCNDLPHFALRVPALKAIKTKAPLEDLTVARKWLDALPQSAVVSDDDDEANLGVCAFLQFAADSKGGHLQRADIPGLQRAYREVLRDAFLEAARSCAVETPRRAATSEGPEMPELAG